MRLSVIITLCLWAQMATSQQITTNNVAPSAKQGNGTKFQLAGSVSGGAGLIACFDAHGNITTVGCVSAGGSVTSVGLSLPSIFSVTVSPITTNGTLTAVFNNQSASTALMGPIGSTGLPTFRTLVGVDIPAINLAVGGNGGITGLLPLANGGTGQNLSAIGKGDLLNGCAAGVLGTTTVGANGTFLKADSTQPCGVLWTAAVGTGTVTNGAALTLNQLVLGAGGNGVATLGSLGTVNSVLHGNAGGAPSFSAVALGSDVSGILPYVNGGTNANTAWTAGSIFFAGASTFAQDNSNLFWDNTNKRLGVGTSSPGVSIGAGRVYLTIKGTTDRGTLELTSAAADADGAAVGLIQYTDSTSGQRIAQIAGSASGTTAMNRGGLMSISTRADAGALTERMRIDNSGNVAIGTTAPGTLSVAGVINSSSGGFKYPDQTQRTTAPAKVAELADYNFSAITPVGSPALTAGAGRTVTLPTCPLGVSGTNTNYTVYFSGGTGTAENAVVTGGTCTPLLANGTLIVTLANNHSGAYTIRPSTAGAYECAVSNSNGTCHVVQGFYSVFGPAYISSRMHFTGDGKFSSVFQTQDGTTGVLDINSNHVTIDNIGFNSTVQGSSAASYAIRLGNAGSITFAIIENTYCEFMYYCVAGIHSSHEVIAFNIFDNFSKVGVLVADPTNPDFEGPRIVANEFYNQVLGGAADACILIHSTSTIFVSDNACIGGAANQINSFIFSDATASGGWITVTGNKCEGITSWCINFDSGTWTQMTFTGNTMFGSVNNWMGARFNGTTGAGMTRGAFTGNVVQGSGTGTNGILLSGTVGGWNISGNTFDTLNIAVNAGATMTNVNIGNNTYLGTLTSNVFCNSTGAVVTDLVSTTFALLTDTTSGQGNCGNSSHAFCSNCNSTCTAGASTGRNCYKENGAWTH